VKLVPSPGRKFAAPRPKARKISFSARGRSSLSDEPFAREVPRRPEVACDCSEILLERFTLTLTVGWVIRAGFPVLRYSWIFPPPTEPSHGLAAGSRPIVRCTPGQRPSGFSFRLKPVRGRAFFLARASGRASQRRTRVNPFPQCQSETTCRFPLGRLECLPTNHSRSFLCCNVLAPDCDRGTLFPPARTSPPIPAPTWGRCMMDQLQLLPLIS